MKRMSSEIYIRDGRTLSKEDRARLKEEHGFKPVPHERKGIRDSLYFLGERHAIPELPRDICLSVDVLKRLIASEHNLPKFTIAISEELFGRLGNNVPLYSTGVPQDIQNVGDLRQQMSEPYIKTVFDAYPTTAD